MINLLMENYNYLIKYKNTIIGVYNTLENAELFIFSCIQNNLMKQINNIQILKYKSNSCYCCDIINFSLSNNNIGLPEENSNIESEEFNTEEQEENEKNKILYSNKQTELTHELNLIKLQEKNLNEKKETYIIDLKLFNQFNDNYNNEIDTIPELFRDKFIFMKQLYDNNNLKFEFYLNYYV